MANISAEQLKSIVTSIIRFEGTFEQAVDVSSKILGFSSYTQFYEFEKGNTKQSIFIEPLLLFYLTSNSELLWENVLGEKFKLLGTELAYSQEGVDLAFNLNQEDAEEEEDEYEEPLFGFELVNNINEYENVFPSELKQFNIEDDDKGNIYLKFDLYAEKAYGQFQYKINVKSIYDYAATVGITVTDLIDLSGWLRAKGTDHEFDADKKICEIFYKITGVRLSL